MSHYNYLKYTFLLCLMTFSACFISDNVRGEKSTHFKRQDKNKMLLNSVKCSWTKEGNFIETVPLKVKSCHDLVVKNWDEKSTKKMMSVTKEYSNCIFSIIEDFQQKFYSTKLNYFDLNSLKKSANDVESLYYRIYCRASLCNDDWKVIASGDSVKIYEDFLKNIYAIVMADLSGDEYSCKTKRSLLQKEVEKYYL